jgi:hypothetical protein
LNSERLQINDPHWQLMSREFGHTHYCKQELQLLELSTMFQQANLNPLTVDAM